MNSALVSKERYLHLPFVAEPIPGTWRWKRLDDVCSGIFDCPHSTPVLTADGPLVVRSQDMRSGVFLVEQAGRVSEETYVERIRRAEPKRGDILYSREGTYFGIAAEVPAETRVCLGQRMVLLRPDEKQIDFRYLRFWLNSPVLATHVYGQRDGTVAERLNMPTIRALPIPLAPLAEQRAIARVLGALDDKIELNRRMNRTLEELAGALFRAWFAEHGLSAEPVLAETLIEQQVLVIGDGYRAKNSEMGSHGTPFVRAGNLQDAGIDLTAADLLRPESVAAAGHKIGVAGDVAFTSKGTVGRLTRVSGKTGAFVYSPQVCFWRSLDPKRLHPDVLYQWMKTDEFLGQVAQVSGQTDMAPYVSLRDQRRMEINLPESESQQNLGTRLAVFDDMIAANNEQSRTLAALRDTLLPKLLSGELRVKNAETAARPGG